jgi:S1-C subfamily serine protease
MTKKNTQEEEINPALLKAIGAVVFIILAAYGYNAYRASQDQSQNQLALQQQTIDATKQQLQALEDQVATQKNIPPPVTDLSLAEIQKEWSPRVVRIGCIDNYYISSGSGVLTTVDFSSIGKSANAPTLITNKHVITDPQTGYLYTSCSFQVSDSDRVLNFDVSAARIPANYDVAYFPSSKSNPPAGASTAMRVCGPKDASIGDKVAIIGYPVNGGTGAASRAITLTAGIISSYDGNYYVTDAKIDHGNSGGAAVLIRKDCYLGIPTWVESGGFESLGRILSAQYVLGAN